MQVHPLGAVQARVRQTPWGDKTLAPALSFLHHIHGSQSCFGYQRGDEAHAARRAQRAH